MAPVRILLLEDSDLDAEIMAARLRKGGVEATIDRVDDREAFAARLEAGGFDLILSDFQLPGFDGRTALEMARRMSPDTPFILVSGVLGEELAIESLKEGATDYVLKQRLARLPGAVQRALSEAHERLERRRAEERLRLLVGELSHRVKNTLATIASIARLTLRRSSSLKAFEDAFLGRLNALAEAHALIFQANWGETELKRVVERTLAPFSRSESALQVDGPRLEVPPKSALALSLILHELATNAVKYGALVQEGGRVRVDWRIEGDPAQAVITWKEMDGPAVESPALKGFGRELIERSARYELDGEVSFDFQSDGLECVISFPADWGGSDGFALNVPKA